MNTGDTKYPNEPAAVTIPIAAVLFDWGKCLATTETGILIAVPPSATPINTPIPVTKNGATKLVKKTASPVTTTAQLIICRHVNHQRNRNCCNEPCPSNPHTPYSGIIAAFRPMAWRSDVTRNSHQTAP